MPSQGRSSSLRKPGIDHSVSSAKKLRGLGERYIRRTREDFPQWGSAMGFNGFSRRLAGSDAATRLERNRFLEHLLADAENLPAAELKGNDWLDRRCFLSLLRTELF